MQFIDEWRTVVHRAWSMRFAAASVFFGALSHIQDVVDVLPQAQAFLPAHVFAVISTVCGVLTIVARLVHQPEMHR